MEGLLLQAQRKLGEANQTEAASLLDEVYTLLPLRKHAPPSAKLLSQKLDLCQVTQNTHAACTNTNSQKQTDIKNPALMFSKIFHVDTC